MEFVLLNGRTFGFYSKCRFFPLWKLLWFQLEHALELLLDPSLWLYLDCSSLTLFLSSNFDLLTGNTNENSKFSKFRQLRLFINRSWTINIAFLKAHPNMTMKVNGFTLIKLEYSRFKCCIMSNFWFYYRCICTIFFQWTAKMDCSNTCSHKKL